MNGSMGTLLRGDAVAVGAWLALLILGLAAVFSCTVDYHGAEQVVPSTVDRGVFLSQLVWAGLGIAVALFCAAVPHRHFEALAYVFYGVSLALLVAVLLVGSEVGGGRRWLGYGGLAFQPSELAKFTLVLALARFLSSRGRRSPFVLVGGALLLVLPVMALVFREPDLGTSLVYPAIAVPLLFWAGVRASLIFALASPVVSAAVALASDQFLHTPWAWGLYVLALLLILYRSRLYILPSLLLLLANLVTGLAVPLVWNKLQPYQQARIVSFFNPSDADRLGYGYQTFQSKVAIGSGGLWGKGYLAGSQKGLAFLPERHTDFIFSVIGEELGLIGALVVLGLFFVLIWRALRIAERARSPFASAVAVGIAAYFAFQVLVNIAIATGLLPVTGLPLPLLSKGGSSMLLSCAMMGMLWNVSARWSEV